MWSVIYWMFAKTHPVMFPLFVYCFYVFKDCLWVYLSIMKPFLSRNAPSWENLLFHIEVLNVSTLCCVLHHTSQRTRKNMDMILFKTLYCTVHLRGQIDTNYTWSQPQLSCGEGLQIAEPIDCLYSKHTSFTVCLASGIKIELANSVPKSATTLPTPHQPLSPGPTGIPGLPH